MQYGLLALSLLILGSLAWDFGRRWISFQLTKYTSNQELETLRKEVASLKAHLTQESKRTSDTLTELDAKVSRVVTAQTTTQMRMPNRMRIGGQ